MRQFIIALALVWTAACVAAFVYSQQQNLPSRLAFILLPAFLIEIGLYLVPGFPEVRKRFDRIASKEARAVLLTLAAIVPYLVVTVRLGSFRFTSFFQLVALAAGVAFWYVWLRPNTLIDIGFLTFFAAIFISKIFAGIYPRPAPHLPLDILGRLMWIRLGLMSVLSIRRMENVRFGFTPNSGEWRIGIQQFLLFIPAGVTVAYFLRVATFRPINMVWWKFPLYVVITFFAILWVVALAEEFFFRGFLQQLLTRGLHSQLAALLVTSILFGLVHLPFRHFPNWRFAIVAGLAGLFYGLAYIRAHSVRACMVTHALVVTTWRVFFI
ncbi:MAG: CPBP family intramembrane metalloprotease [Acidobacteriota bacterium]|nr:CPBP family intramembrane metalloprotease [Acidobacteriota bacterium]